MKKFILGLGSVAAAVAPIAAVVSCGSDEDSKGTLTITDAEKATVITALTAHLTHKGNDGMTDAVTGTAATFNKVEISYDKKGSILKVDYKLTVATPGKIWSANYVSEVNVIAGDIIHIHTSMNADTKAASGSYGAGETIGPINPNSKALMFAMIIANTAEGAKLLS